MFTTYLFFPNDYETVVNRDEFVDAILAALRRFGLVAADVVAATISQGSIVMTLFLKTLAAQQLVLQASLAGLVARVNGEYYQGFPTEDLLPTTLAPTATSGAKDGGSGAANTDVTDDPGGGSADRSLVLGLAVCLAVFLAAVLVGAVWFRAQVKKAATVSPAAKQCPSAGAGDDAEQVEEGLAKLTRAWHAERRLEPVLPTQVPSKRRGSLPSSPSQRGLSGAPERVIVRPALSATRL